MYPIQILGLGHDRGVGYGLGDALYSMLNSELMLDSKSLYELG